MVSKPGHTSLVAGFRKVLAYKQAGLLVWPTENPFKATI